MRIMVDVCTKFGFVVSAMLYLKNSVYGGLVLLGSRKPYYLEPNHVIIRLLLSIKTVRKCVARFSISLLLYAL